jgi:hypothetical protein
MPAHEEQGPQAPRMGTQASLASSARRLAEAAADQALAAAEAVGNEKLRYRVQAAMSAARGAVQLTGARPEGRRSPNSAGSRIRDSLKAAQQLRQAGQVEAARLAARQALTEARTSADSLTWMAIIADLAENLVETGEREEANAAATAVLIEASGFRPSQFASTAKQLARLGLSEPSRIAAAKAVQAADEYPRGGRRARALARVAEILAHADLSETAKAAAVEALAEGRREGDDQSRALAIADAAYVLAESGQVQLAEAAAVEALAAASEVSSGYSRVQALTVASERLAWTGQNELAARGAELALEAAYSISDQRRRNEGLARAAVALTQAGQIESAVESACAISDQRQRNEGLARAAVAFAEAGQPGLAGRTLRMIDSRESRGTAVENVVNILGRTGLHGPAGELALEIADGVSRARVLTSLAQILVETGQAERAHTTVRQALETTRAIRGRLQRTQVLADLVDRFASLGEIGLAYDAARAIDFPWRRVAALIGLVRVLVHTRQTEAARTIAREALAEAGALRSVNDFVALARLLSEIGDAEEARAAVNEGLTIARAVDSAEGFAWVASWLAETGETQQAAAVAGEALTAAQGVGDTRYRAKVMVDVTRILVKTGRAQEALAAAGEALAAAREVDDPGERAKELADVAVALIDLFGPFHDTPPAPEGTPRDGVPPEEPAWKEQRYLECQAPRNVRRASDFSILVRITERQKTAGGTPFMTPAIPEQGMRLYVVLHVPAGCSAITAAMMPIDLPARGDSDEAHFVIRASEAVGSYRFIITVLWGNVSGQVLARQPIKVTVSSRPTEPLGPTLYPTRPLSPDRATVGLVVVRSSAKKYLYVLSKTGHSPITDELHLEADPRSRLRMLTNELNTMARGGSGWRPASLRDELRARGSDLWRDFLPNKIRDALSGLRAGEDTLCISCDNSVLAVPWEMIYPIDSIAGQKDFLVQLFDVIRSPESTTAWRENIALSPASIVLPDAQLSGASEEAQAISEILGHEARYIREKVALQQELRSGGFGLLHVVAHSRDGQGTITLAANQKFRPWDLNEFAGTGGHWSNRRPLVFINACGTAASRQTFTQYTSWAQRFFEAGAGGFIGSMWDVRSETACAFARRFYEAMYTEGRSFGEALHDAREYARSRNADPTWLAYAAHGNHSATALGSS